MEPQPGKNSRLKLFLNKTEAFQLFGRTKVEHWLEMGPVAKRKDGDHSAAWRLDRLEPEVIARSVYLLKHDL